MKNTDTIKVGTKFIGNVNNVIFEVIKIENKSAIIKNSINNKIFHYGLNALQHCDITIL